MALKSLDSRLRGNDDLERSELGNGALTYRHSREGGNPEPFVRERLKSLGLQPRGSKAEPDFAGMTIWRDRNSETAHLPTVIPAKAGIQGLSCENVSSHWVFGLAEVKQSPISRE